MEFIKSGTFIYHIAIYRQKKQQEHNITQALIKK